MLTALVDADPLAALTDRERQILDQVAGGTEAKQPMNVNGLDDYREGVVWLIGGGAFALLGLAGMDWLGVQSWYLYALGAGLLLVAVIIALVSKLAVNRLRHGWLPLIIALIASGVLAVASAEVSFADIFPLVVGLLWIGTGLWLMLWPEPKSGGAGQ